MKKSKPNRPQYDFTSFKELLNEISWSWQYPDYKFEKTNNGGYALNKLYISEKEVTYKMEKWTIHPQAWLDFVRFTKFLEGVK